MLADGGANATPLLDGEPINLCIATNVISWKMSNWLRGLLNNTGSSIVRELLLVCYFVTDYLIFNLSA